MRRTSASFSAEAASSIRDAQYETPEIQALLTSEKPGDRLIGLAAVQSLGDPATFDAVLERATDPAIPFEQYQALRALESLRPSLPEQSAMRIVQALDDPSFLTAIGPDASRRNLADRLSKSLKSTRR